MAFDPSLPPDEGRVFSAVLRAQLNALKGLIDAVPAGPPGPPGGPGPVGAAGPAVSVSDMTRLCNQLTGIGTGTVAMPFTVASAHLGWMLGQRLRATSAADPGNWMEGVIDTIATSVVTFIVDATGGSGTFDDWTLTLASARPLTATSGNNVSLGSAAVDISYTAPGPVGWKAGTRLRATSRSTPANWFEGVLTVFTTTTLHLEVDTSNGTPGDTFNDWDLSPPPGPDGVATLDTPFPDPDSESLRQTVNALIVALQR